MVAVGACVYGFEEWRPADFAKESARQEVALSCHTACLFRVELFKLKAALHLLLHAFDQLRTWGQCDVLVVGGDEDPLDFMLQGRRLSFALLHVVAKRAAELFKLARGGLTLGTSFGLASSCSRCAGAGFAYGFGGIASSWSRGGGALCLTTGVGSSVTPFVIVGLSWWGPGLL